MSEISVCIPTYEFKGEGVKFLSELFDSLRKQTFQDFNIIISDHSVDDEIYNFCEKSSEDFEIIYIRNMNGRGNLGPNTNCAIEHSTGRIIKILYQDDILFDENSLQLLKDNYDKGSCKWAFNSFCHTKDGVSFFNTKTPKWSDMMLEGRNLLGNPSGLSMLNECKMYMDDNLNLLVDTELYHRMRMNYGPPCIISDILTCTREHENRTSSSRIPYDRFIEHPEGGWLVTQKELDYVEAKHREFCRGGRKYPDEN